MSVPVISVAQMREWEQATWDAGITEKGVIAQVGKKLGFWLQTTALSAHGFVIVAGKGNNGEDARQSLPFFESHSLPAPLVVNVKDPVTDFAELDRALSEHRDCAIVDALFGIGLNRTLSEDWIRVIERLNDSRSEVYSVDCPSGLDSDTGRTMGAAIRATRTLTLGAPKRGLLTPQAIEYVGRLETESDIGLVECPFEDSLNWTEGKDFEDFPPRRSIASHKGSHGHLAIVAGSSGYHGAAVLAAEGAFNAMPGLVSVFAHEPCYIPVASQLKAAMVHPWTEGIDFPDKATAILVGPGLANEQLPESVRGFVRKLWAESPVTVIADASALDWLPEGKTPEGAIRLMTPHPGEAARMLGTDSKEIQADRASTLKRLSEKYGNCFVVLKGHQTLVGNSIGPVYINSTGNPLLAQGGSGDVLAGFLAGLLAQPILTQDALRTIRYAIWAHGMAADHAAASDAPLFIGQLPKLIRGDFGDDSSLWSLLES